MYDLVAQFLSSDLGLLTAGAGFGSLALVLIRKYLPAYIGKLTGNLIEHALNPDTQDPKERELQRKAVLALVELAEYKYPDSGQGEHRFNYVADFLGKWMPRTKAETIRDIIEDSVRIMDETAKAEIQEAHEEDSTKK